MYDIEKLLKILTDPVYRVIDENGNVFLLLMICMYLLKQPWMVIPKQNMCM